MTERQYGSVSQTEEFSRTHTFPEHTSPEINLPFGNALIYGIRHGEVDNHGQPQGRLTEKGSQQIRYTTRTIIGEVSRFNGVPIDLYYFHTDRLRTEESLEDLYFEFEKQIAIDKSTNGPLRNANVREIAKHPLLDNADDISALFRMLPNETKQLKSAVLPAWLNSDPDVLRAMGVSPSEATLKNTLLFFSKFNEMAKNDPHSLKVGIAINHEHALASLLTAYYPDFPCQPAFAEAFVVNTGNNRQEAELTFRSRKTALYLPEYYMQTNFTEQLNPK